MPPKKVPKIDKDQKKLDFRVTQNLSVTTSRDDDDDDDVEKTHVREAGGGGLDECSWGMEGCQAKIPHGIGPIALTSQLQQ